MFDNNSSDRTVEVASRTWNELSAPFPIQIVSEPKQGLSYAHDTGFKQAEHELIIVCDDDNLLTEWKGKYKGAPYRTYVGRKYIGGYSDHFPVFVYLVREL